jgi:phosphatidate cytidylyltransferase
MSLLKDPPLLMLFGGILGVLIVASLAGAWMRRRSLSPQGRATVANFNVRTRAWWGMVAVFVAASALGPLGTVLFFALGSFLALREFITLAPTRPADYNALFWAFFIITPYHYLLVALDWYGFYIMFIPVYAFLFIPARNAIAGDTERFLERSAVMQWGLMVCVYCISHAAALLHLPIPGHEGKGARLLLFLMLVDQLSDVFQYIWGKLLGRTPISAVSPNKTWEGLILGGGSAVALGAGLWWATPFTPWQAAGLSLAIVVMGFLGGLVMSAVKRDRGVKDFGTVIEGHGGALDRLDSVCFAAPVFFHLTRYFFVP